MTNTCLLCAISSLHSLPWAFGASAFCLPPEHLLVLRSILLGWCLLSDRSQVQTRVNCSVLSRESSQDWRHFRK